MSIPAEVERLLVLQDKDTRLRRIDRELQRIPAEVEALEARISQARGALDAAREELQKLEIERNRLDVDIKSKEQAISRFKTQQQQTRKNDEYQALSHEIERFQSDIGELETAELEAMEEIDAVKARMSEAERVFADEKDRLGGEIDVLGNKREALDKQRAEVLAERERLAAEVEPELLGIYGRLLKSKGDAVVVAVEHDVCTGCHMKLTTQTVHKVRAAREIVHCENCSRILYEAR